MTDATSEAFAGTDRYEITGTLGAGGMGVVYDALDRDRNVRVALKTLKTISPRALFRFKQEFRSLAGIEHPNLIQLHELVAVGDLWFFTMDYVPGVELMDYVRPAAVSKAPPEDAPTIDELVTETREELPASILAGLHGSFPEPPSDVVCRPKTSLEGCDLNRLRSSFSQLADGLFALHSEGKLHRDIKPSNVLVTDEGRVVLLDFGLIAQMEQVEQPDQAETDTTIADEVADGVSEQAEPAGIYQTMDQSVSGTAAYMAPEQAIHRPLSEASDWYAVGTMLYEALTGQLPFAGSVMDLLRRKIREHAPDPSDLIPDVPDDLRLLCLDLLARNPDNRPSGREVLDRLSVSQPVQTDGFAISENVAFVGRESQLRAMQEAFQSVLDGQTSVVEVDGLSGMGKSTLVDRFLGAVQREHRALVLRGQCYEQESVPYKGIDNLVDELAKFLLRLPDGQEAELLVADVSLLARIFPVLNQVAAISRLVEQSADVGDPRAIRSRAFVAFAELLRRIGQTRPLILAIDDLQWGDADSAILLNELLQSEVSLQIMIVLAFRGEYVDTSPCLKALRQAGWRRRSRARTATSHGSANTVSLETIRLRPLSAEDLCELVAEVLPVDQSLSQAEIDQIVHESGGSPYFVQELVRWIGSGRELASSDNSIAGLDAVLWARAKELPDSARRLLVAVAIAGQPISMRHAFHASGLEQLEPRSLKSLYAGRFIRSTGTRLDDEVATFHDRVRESVTANVAMTTRERVYANLAASLITDESVDPEMIADCSFHAGDFDTAGRYYEKAAQNASNSLAFSRAAFLFRLALEHSPKRGVSQLELRRKLADALANAGLGTEAADEYLAVSGAFEGREQLLLEGLAGFHYCTGARIGRGRRLLQSTLRRVGIRLPDSPIGAIIALGRERTLQWLRGNNFELRTVDEVDPQELLRIDIAWNAAKALSLFDTISGASILAKALRLALKCGEPRRIATLLAWEATLLVCSRFRFEIRQGEEMLKLAHKVASQTNDPYCAGMVELAESASRMCTGDSDKGVRHAVAADEIFRNQCTGVAWERDSSQMFHTWSLMWRGLYTELGPFAEAAVVEAQDRGDVYAATSQAVMALAVARLASGDPDGAERGVELNLARWSRSGFHLPYLLAACSRSMISIYRGRPEDAYDGLANDFRAVKRALHLEVRILEINYYGYRARAAAAALFDDPDRTELAITARRDAKRLSGMKVAWVTAQADAVLAALASMSGHPDKAMSHLRSAITGFDSVKMESFAAACRIRLGELLQNGEGDAMRRRGEEWMRRHNVAEIPRMIDVLVPGFEDPRSL
ncbi:MAG: protein kinase [Planctomycetota bacterium]|nr:protein kinase [Planctomycetota bacterium]MDA1251092.1 protein kinase [Planctomycetota bacterium]